MRFATYLVNKGLLDVQTIEETLASCEEEAIVARDKFYAMDPADPTEIFDHLYESVPKELETQREEYLRRLRQKGIDQ